MSVLYKYCAVSMQDLLLEAKNPRFASSTEMLSFQKKQPRYQIMHFFNYKFITSIAIPNNVTIIGTEAFSGCSNFVNIVIPDSVISIGASAFLECNNLISIVFEDAFDQYGTGSYYEWNQKKGRDEITVTDPSINALYFTTTYIYDYWYKNQLNDQHCAMFCSEMLWMSTIIKNVFIQCSIFELIGGTAVISGAVFFCKMKKPYNGFVFVYYHFIRNFTSFFLQILIQDIVHPHSPSLNY